MRILSWDRIGRRAPAWVGEKVAMKMKGHDVQPVHRQKLQRQVYCGRTASAVNGAHHSPVVTNRSPDCRYNAAVAHDSCVLHSRLEQDSEALAVKSVFTLVPATFSLGIVDS